MHTTQINIDFEKGVRLLSRVMPQAETMRKPTLFHSIRVGVYLYQNGYDRDVILAGLLHDALEFTDIPESTLRAEFGDAVTNMVLACSKDESIEDAQERTDQLIGRCVAAGEPALIVKTADILDSFTYYTVTNNQEQLVYCKRNKEAIVRLKPVTFTDKIFTSLDQIIR